MKRPAFWIVLGLIAAASALIAWRLFPQAFSIVALDITMDAEAARAAARTIAAEQHLGPAGYQQAASFSLDSDAQTFVELEAGGKDAFTRMLREGLYSAYTWRVRHFREGETNETLFRFTPDGRPYGFVERLREDTPGAQIDPATARQQAESAAAAAWGIEFARFALVEQGQERRPGGRVDHTLTYERPEPTLADGRYRLRLVVSGDRLTEVTHFIRIPEAFSRRYENLRSANEAIGIGSAVAMVLLYVFGGIGLGLFFMMRQRWVVWRPAAVWGAIVGVLQALAAVNQWPLIWMTYDTAVPRATFIAQQLAIVAATLVGFSAFFALSFMAAESLTRRAFGSHPQLWRVWARGPGSSTAVLGRTVAGYLLVAVFFAYEVILYLFATRTLGWWTPAEALIHPDVLATYVPWLSAIANSLQAGFWEEALFRAVPLAGAALIGERLGLRTPLLVIAFIVQAVVFGAGHAPYPTLPSYARPVELILPSIGFGLLYVYFGLLPAIVLHFAFDVVWFALPIFLADAPGIWFQQAMVVVMTFVPLWIVLWRRTQAGGWTELSPSALNASWMPPSAAEPAAAAPAIVQHALGAGTRRLWYATGVVALVVCAATMAAREERSGLTIGRAEAAAIARRALEQRGVTLEPRWRVLPSPQDGSDSAHEFVAQTAGQERRDALIGTYLPAPRWVVRVAAFEGDVAERAEEWHVAISGKGEVLAVRHTLPERRPGATLEEEAARRLAVQALQERTGLNAAAGQAREVSATPARLQARTDWTFTFADATLPPLPQGELRVSVAIAGDEVVQVRRFVHVPQDWERRARAAGTRNLILRVLSGVVFGGLLVSAAVSAVVAWSRRRYAPALFLAAAALMLLVSAANGANGWPAIAAGLPTAQPFRLQVFAIIGLGAVGLTISALLVGLATGALPHRLAGQGSLPDRDALALGVAGGLFGAAGLSAAAWLRTPPWAGAPDVSPLGTFFPILDVVLDPVPAFLMRTAIVLTLLASVTVLTAGWTKRRMVGSAMILAAGFLGAGTPSGVVLTGWLMAGALTAVALWVGYVFLLRADLSMVPIALGTMMAIASIGRGVQQPFPGALPAGAASAVVLAGLCWWWFRLLRRARARAAAPPSAAHMQPM
ncbi:MAG TPA: type II CAAX endopeptidase family protein [Vicinamibacterales bacterium]|nr:type II CAAX endopeptidase family protein [Vicinamibacterales bacterium]